MVSDFVPCSWCKRNPGCENEGFHEKCEFRTLKYEKEEIVKRARDEWIAIQKIKSLLLKEKDAEVAKIMAVDVLDKSNALQTMMAALREDFGMRLGEMTREIGLERPSIIESVKLMAKLKKMQKERGR